MGLRSGVAVRLWCRPAPAAPIQPVAWELPYATSVALKEKKNQTKQKESRKLENLLVTQLQASDMARPGRVGAIFSGGCMYVF